MGSQETFWPRTQWTAGDGAVPRDLPPLHSRLQNVAAMPIETAQALGAETVARPSEIAEGLRRTLASLGSSVRLELLHSIRVPRTLHEIRIQSRSPRGVAGAAHRHLARQTIRVHLDRLIESGLISTRRVKRASGAATQYLVNHRAFYTLAEEIRELAAFRPSEDIDDTTRNLASFLPAIAAKGPGLRLVKGLGEGRWFPLQPSVGRRSQWVIGRKKGVAVRLDYDAFVSGENALISAAAGRFTLLDLPGTRNGTSLNFQRLAPKNPTRLTTGDVIGVGRSLLVFQV